MSKEFIRDLRLTAALYDIVCGRDKIFQSELKLLIQAADLIENLTTWRDIEGAPERCLVRNEHGEIFEGVKTKENLWYSLDPRGGGDYILNPQPIEYLLLPPTENKDDTSN